MPRFLHILNVIICNLSLLLIPTILTWKFHVIKNNFIVQIYLQSRKGDIYILISYFVLVFALIYSEHLYYLNQ